VTRPGTRHLLAAAVTAPRGRHQRACPSATAAGAARRGGASGYDDVTGAGSPGKSIPLPVPEPSPSAFPGGSGPAARCGRATRGARHAPGVIAARDAKDPDGPR